MIGFKGLYGKEEIPGEEWYLKVLREGNLVYFRAVNREGREIEQGSLFQLDMGVGRVRFYGAVNPDLGLDLDERGKIRLI